MKRHSLMKRAMAYLLIFAMIGALLPGMAVAASEKVEAPPVDLQGAALLNIQSMSSPQFFAEHVRSGSDTSFNLEYHFLAHNSGLSPFMYVNPKGAGAEGSPLSFNTTYTRKSNGKLWQGLYEAPYTSFGGVVEALAQTDQLQYNLSAALKRDYHSNIPNHLSKTSDEAWVELYDSYGMIYGQQLYSIQGLESDPNRTYVQYGDEGAKNWHPFTIPATQSTGTSLGIKFGTNHSCTCGSSGVRGLAFALADVQYPEVTKIQLTDADGNAIDKTHFMGGNEGYITLQFSEQIRFASQTPPELNTVPLDLTMIRVSNNQEIKDPNFKAWLVKLTDNAMIFKFTVPQEINGEATNHMIIGINSIQSWVKNIGSTDLGSNDFPLTLYGKDNRPVSLGAQSSKQGALTRSSSLVTDLAGNPVDWNASVKAIGRFIIDCIPPQVADVELSGARISQDNLYETPENGQWPADIDRSAVFAGKADTFYATVVLSEEMATLTAEQQSNTKATFNLTAKMGGAVTATVANSYCDNADGNRTKLVFGPISTDVYPQEDPAPIRITQVDFARGVTDLSGNPIEATVTVTKNPKQQLWVDTTAPWADPSGLNKDDSNSAWMPLRYQDGGDDKDAFYVPVQVKDLGNWSNNPAYTSGLENLTGTFSLNTGGQPYRYTASYDPARPGPEAYQEGSGSGTFTQAVSTNIYLHFQLIDGVPYNFNTVDLVVGTRDYAGNRGTNTISLAQKGDGTGPVIRFPSLNKTFDSASRTGAVSVEVSVADEVNNLLSVEYRWDEGQEWNSAGIGENAVQTHTFTKDVTSLKDGVAHTGTLHVRATDIEGNTSESAVSYSYDLTKPAYSYRLEFDRLEAPGNYPDYQNMITDNKHRIWVEAPPLYSGSDGTVDASAATSFFLIEDRLSPEEGDYFVRTFTRSSAGGEDQGGYVYKTKSGHYTDPDFSRWYHATYQQEGDTYQFSNVVPLDPDTVQALLKGADDLVMPAPEEPVPSEPVPSEPIPSEPVPSEPVPSEPVPSEPVPSEPVPSEPAPSEPAPSEPAPSEPVPSEPVSEEPVPGAPIPEELAPRKIKFQKLTLQGQVPSVPMTEEPVPSEPVPSEPVPSEPVPSEPVPSEPVPSEPVPSEPVPSEPVPSEPVPSEPVPSEPIPSEPIPSEPVPSEPVPSEPVPSEPVPSNPVPNEPAPPVALELLTAEVSPQELAELQTRLDTQWRGYYGDQNAMLLTVYGNYPVPPASFTSNYVSIEPLPYRSASYPVMQEHKAPHVVSFGKPLAPGGAEIDLDPVRGEYDPNDSGSIPRYVNSLAGAQVPIIITNRYAPDWGADDVDFAKSKVTLTYLGYTRTSAVDEGVEWALDFPLVPGAAQQRFTFPDELPERTYQSGYYNLRVTLSVLGAGERNNHIEAEGMRTVEVFDEIFLYMERPDTYGMDDFNINVWYENQFVENFSKISGSLNDGYITDVKLGTYEEPGFTRTQELVFDVEGLPSYGMAISKPSYWEDLTKVYWQVWNADDPDGGKNAPYAVLSGNWNRIDVNPVDSIGPGDYRTPDGKPAIPILKGQERNTICFRFALQNGYISPVRQVTAHVRGGAPQLTVSVSPEKPADGSLVNRVEMTFDRAFSPNGALVKYMVFGLPDVMHYEPFTAEIKGSGTYTAVICDEFGNATAAEKSIDYVDGVPPMLFLEEELDAPEGEFHYRCLVTDDRPITAGRLSFAQFDTAGGNATQGEVPLYYDGSAWEARGPQQSGVYYSRLISQSAYDEVTGQYTMLLEVKGICPYLEGDGVPASDTRRIRGVMSDDMGNRDTSDVTTGTIAHCPNQKPDCIGVAYDRELGLVLTFNTLVRQAEGAGYSRTLTGLPIYANGDHDITFQDLFGNTYTTTVTVNAFGNLGLEADLSETRPTRNDVVVTLSAKEGSLIRSIDPGDEANVPNLAEDGKSATVIVKANATLMVEVWDGTTQGNVRLFPITVTNIDRELEPVEVRFTYADPPVAGETTGDVTASLHCAEPIEGLGGEALVYTFQFGGPAEYTFRYRDEAGNEGEKTVTCPVVITGVGEAPSGLSYDVELQQKRQGLYTTCLRYSSEEDPGEWTTGMEEAVKVSAQGYRLSFESQTRGVKLFVTEPGTAAAPDYEEGISAEIAGVTVNGLMVTVAQAADFRVWLVDRWNNAASLDAALSNIDNSKPTGTVEYVAREGGRRIRAYLKPDQADTLVTNRAGVDRETQGDHVGLYYHDFTENGSFVFYLENLAGNTGEVTARVSTLDTVAPSIQEPTWFGERVKPTNRPISVKFVLNKNIRDITAAWVSPSVAETGSHITVQISGSTATITYLKNTPALILTFTALNGLTAEYTLDAVTNMDLTPPSLVGAVDVAIDQDRRSAVLSFTTSEDVLCAQVPVYNDQNERILTTSFTTAVSENGTYRFHLVDAAGNTTWAKTQVAGIDPVSLTLRYSRTGTDEDAADYAFRLGQLVDGDMFYVMPNKAAKVVYSVDGAPVDTRDSAAPDAWTGPFTIREGRGAYTVTATDQRGESVSAALNVLPPDIIKPVLLARRPTAPVPQNASTEELTGILTENLIVTDDRSARENVILDFNTAGVDLSRTGLQSVQVTATDEAGNTSAEAALSIRVYGPEDLYAQVGGELTFPGGTALAEGGSVAIQLFNLPEDEAYTISYKAGYKTTGQMKIGATPVVDGVMVLEPGRYYTVYVRTQSRKELLFYVLAE